MELALPALRTGTYAAVWTVLAEDDGHATSGVIPFRVGSGGAPAAAVLTTSAGPSTPTLVGLRWLRLGLLAGVVGSLAVALLVLGRATDPRRYRVTDALRAGRLRLLTIAGTCAALAVPVTLVEAVPWGVTRDGTASAFARFVEGTRGGHLLVAQVVVLVLLSQHTLRMRAVAASTYRTARTPAAAAGILVGALAVLEALRGHVASLGEARVPAVTADAVHVACALLWLGALPAFLVAVLPARGGGALARHTGRAFSRLAGGSVLLLVATGLYTAGREVHDPAALLSTRYGGALLAKALLLVVLLAIALVNNARLHRDGPGVTRRLVLVEMGVGAVALAVAALLAQSVPSPTAPVVPATAERPVMDAVHADLVVSASAAPDRPGANAFTVLAASRLRPEPAPIDAVRLRLAGGPELRMTRVGPDRFVSTGRIDGRGLRAVTVRVVRDGRTYAVPLRWRLAPEPPLVAVEPRRTLSSYTTPLAVAILAAAALFLPARAARRRLRLRRSLQEVPG